MRLLILGTGGMANNHATYFSQIPGVELVAAVDVDDVVGAGLCASPQHSTLLYLAG